MNPLFPLNEYVPDGEPHVFGDRVYLYGSHDEEGGTRFCTQDYTVWSAPVTDLSDWTCHGVAYKKSRDPRSREDKLVDFYAPDCVRGNDGRYYLYYFAAGPNTSAFGPLSVAVSDRPEGPFEYLSDIKYQDGTPVLKYLTNDPAVINDNGKIYLYYGWGFIKDFRNPVLKPLYNFVLSKLCNRSLADIRKTKPSILSCAVAELEADMCTVKGEPKGVLDSLTTAKRGTPLYEHPFYEAPSIRKFGEWYYLIYSSNKNNELAYAMSKHLDRGFEYKGVLISNSDLGYKGNKKPKMTAGTIHGSVELIGGKYYVFYHRCTNDTDFSRQACAEPITINADGTFSQVEITTQGVSAPLPAKGEYLAALCCNLYNATRKDKKGKRAIITAKNGESYITRIKDGTVIGYKYFDFQAPKKVFVTVRGGAGELLVKTAEHGAAIGRVKIEASEKWRIFSSSLQSITGKIPLYFEWHGKPIEFLQFELR